MIGTGIEIEETEGAGNDTTKKDADATNVPVRQTDDQVLNTEMIGKRNTRDLQVRKEEDLFLRKKDQALEIEENLSQRKEKDHRVEKEGEAEVQDVTEDPGAEIVIVVNMENDLIGLVIRWHNWRNWVSYYCSTILEFCICICLFVQCFSEILAFINTHVTVNLIN